jgi:hypothetical protein
MEEDVVMPDDAMRAMLPPPSIVPKDEPKPFTVTPRPDAAPTRGRGRPPGSRNRVKPVEGGVNPPQRMKIPPPRVNEPVDQTAAKKEEKKARAEQYATFINTELNDKLFMFIIGATGMPAEALYKEGRVPAKAQTNPALTEMGNAIAIPADVADSWGKLLAELSYTDAGKSLTKMSENHAMTVVAAAIAAAFSTFRYAQQMKPILDMLKEAQARKAKAAESNGEGTA